MAVFERSEVMASITAPSLELLLHRTLGYVERNRSSFLDGAELYHHSDNPDESQWEFVLRTSVGRAVE